MRGVLKVLVKKGPLGVHFLTGVSQQNSEPTWWPFLGQVFRTATICIYYIYMYIKIHLGMEKA